MRGLTLVLADNQHLLREGLRLLLETRLDCRVVGEATTGTEAMALVQEHHPDILIVDLSLPGGNGIEVIRTVRTQMQDTQVIVLAMGGNEPHVQEVLRAGAMAYILKDALVGDFLHAIAQVMAGRRYLSPNLAERAINAFAWHGQPAPESAPEVLSLREREVLLMVAQGMTSAAIASQLSIGVRTVEWHRARLLQKLHLRSIADLVRYTIQHGLLPSTERHPITQRSF